MCVKLKRESVWLDFLLLSDDTNEVLAIIIGDDGCLVPVPVVVLLAASPLVRSISAPSCCPVTISVPTVSEDVLRAVVEIMKAGQVEMKYELIDDVADRLKLLEVGAELISEKAGSDLMSGGKDEYIIDKILTESSEVNTKVKKECLTKWG